MSVDLKAIQPNRYSVLYLVDQPILIDNEIAERSYGCSMFIYILLFKLLILKF
jgi:hypothetical protein